MLKKPVSYAVFAVIMVVVFNLLDFVFDRFIAYGPFTFDSLSNIILPLLIAVLVIWYLSMLKKYIKKAP